MSKDIRTTESMRRDQFSYSDPDTIQVRHIDLDLEVKFDDRAVKGVALLVLDREFVGKLVLDTQNLHIDSVESSLDGQHFIDAIAEVGETDPKLGAPLTVHVPAPANMVRVSYTTGPDASGLQWLEPEQTSGKKDPFLFTQSEATHARSWIPLQDTPRVRMTYAARVRTRNGLNVLMSAQKLAERPLAGEHRFSMSQPIPSYLIAMAVGDLGFRELSYRTGVYAEPAILDRAAREFEDVEQMLATAEGLFGPYRWERYDVLVLPPSFPVGGMENPRLSFVTPTVIAGDKSLISLVTHELAHSWSSNLVNNATWNDFWLNEGITVYIERRISEKLYGRQRAEMEAACGVEELHMELAGLKPEEQVLYPEAGSRDPNAGLSHVPYEKGALFLRALEETFGRPQFDSFLRGYLDDLAFHSITTAEFIEYLHTHLLSRYPTLAARIPVEEWIYKPGVPSSAPRPTTNLFGAAEDRARMWILGTITTENIPEGTWTASEWLHFLKSLPAELSTDRMAELDRRFDFTRSSNVELLSQWLVMAIRNNYGPAYQRVESLLTTVGRRKYLKALYSELAKTTKGRDWALKIYRQARDFYHPISRVTVEGILTASGNVVGQRAGATAADASSSRTKK